MMKEVAITMTEAGYQYLLEQSREKENDIYVFPNEEDIRTVSHELETAVRKKENGVILLYWSDIFWAWTNPLVRFLTYATDAGSPLDTSELGGFKLIALDGCIEDSENDTIVREAENMACKLDCIQTKGFIDGIQEKWLFVSACNANHLIHAETFESRDEAARAMKDEMESFGETVHVTKSSLNLDDDNGSYVIEYLDGGVRYGHIQKI